MEHHFWSVCVNGSRVAQAYALVENSGVKVACTRGCSYCCSLQVEVQPHETFTLAEWLKRHFSPDIGARNLLS